VRVKLQGVLVSVAGLDVEAREGLEDTSSVKRLLSDFLVVGVEFKWVIAQLNDQSRLLVLINPLLDPFESGCRAILIDLIKAHLSVSRRVHTSRNQLNRHESRDAEVPIFAREHEATGSENKPEELEGYSA
jgi:hypothetical protein